MNGVAGSPTFQFLERLAEVFQDLTVDEFDLTCRVHNGDKGRNAIEDLRKMEVADTQGFLTPLSVFNIGTSCVPSNDVALIVSNRSRQGGDSIDHRPKLVRGFFHVYMAFSRAALA
jgi:hypothetical protein